MSTYYLSMQPSTTAQIDLILLTGTTGEARVQADAPATTITIGNSEIATAQLGTDESGGPALFIEAKQAGATTITINSGGVVRYEVSVETMVTGLRWVPRDANVVSRISAIPTPPLEPGGVDGPNSSENGGDYWLQRNLSDRWFIWWDVDTDPGPDVKKPLETFLNDNNVAETYRNDVAGRAAELGFVS